LLKRINQSFLFGYALQLLRFRLSKAIDFFFLATILKIAAAFSLALDRPVSVGKIPKHVEKG
jgi:hypothetical protein